MITVRYVVKDNIIQFNLHEEGVLKLSKNVTKKLKHFRQINIYDKEAGGVLLGRFILNSNNIVIDSITEPQEKDKRSRFFFKKIDSNHQKTMDIEWNDSNGTNNFIGEWHSHPENEPTPSILDVQEWKRKSKEDVYDNSFLIFVIVGIDSISAWVVNKTDQSIIKLVRRDGKEKK